MRSELNHRVIIKDILCPEVTTFDFKDWLWEVINSTKEDTLISIISLAYGIWYARNKKVFENWDIHPKETISKANQVILDYMQCEKLATDTKTCNKHTKFSKSGDKNKLNGRNLTLVKSKLIVMQTK